MSKGDKVTVYVAVGGTTAQHTVVASKAGRWVEVVYPSPRAKDQSVTIFERTRNNRPAGHTLRVRLDALVALEEVRRDDAP